MKKIIRNVMIIVLLLVTLVLVDRHVHVKKIADYNGKTFLQVSSSLITKAPKQSWLDFEEFDMKVYSVNMYVDHYNPLFKTWKDEYACSTGWIYKGDGGQPFTMYVSETSSLFPVEMVYMPEATFTNVYGDVVVNYSITTMADRDEEFAIELNKDDRSVRMSFKYDHLKKLYPVLEKVYRKF